jgi:two-component system response regulator MprA
MGSRVPARRPVILIADDEAVLRQVLTELLDDEGYQVLTASDGDEALQLARDQHPDLSLLDLRRPKLDGAAFCRAYRDAGGQAPLFSSRP